MNYLYKLTPRYSPKDIKRFNEHKSGVLLLTGNIKVIDKGSSAVRTLISFSAGKATIKK